jgi:hypothetical protein
MRVAVAFVDSPIMFVSIFERGPDILIRVNVLAHDRPTFGGD